MHEAHLRDSVALAQTFHWLEQEVSSAAVRAGSMSVAAPDMAQQPSLSHACSTELVRLEAMLQAARTLGLLGHACKTPETPGGTAHDPMGHARHSCVSIQDPDTSRLQKPGWEAILFARGTHIGQISAHRAGPEQGQHMSQHRCRSASARLSQRWCGRPQSWRRSNADASIGGALGHQ